MFFYFEENNTIEEPYREIYYNKVRKTHNSHFLFARHILKYRRKALIETPQKKSILKAKTKRKTKPIPEYRYDRYEKRILSNI